MAPAFLTRKSDNKAPELIIVGTDEPNLDLAQSQPQQPDLPLRGQKPNRIRFDPHPSSSPDHAESQQPDDTGAASTSDTHGDAQPQVHGFRSAVNQFLRNPRVAVAESKDLLSIPFSRNRSASAPTDPAELLGPKPVDIPVPWPPYLLASNKVTERPASIASGPDSIGEELQASAWARRSRTGKMRASLLSPESAAHWRQGSPSTRHQRTHSDGSIQFQSYQDMSDLQQSPELTPQIQSRRPLSSISPWTAPRSANGTSTLDRPNDRSSFSEDEEQLHPVAFYRGGHQRAISVPIVSGARIHAPSITKEDSSLAEVTNLKAAHAAQIAYINDDHAREIASLRTYISLLEKRATLPVGHFLSPSGLLPPLDTSSRPHSRDEAEPHSRPPSCDSALRPSSASLRSFENTMEQQRVQIDEAMHEMDDLKSAMKQQDAELYEKNRKLSLLQETLSLKERSVSQMRGAMLRAAEKENTLKTKLADLQTRLDLVEDERLELMERANDVKIHVRTLAKQNTALQKQLNETDEQCGAQVQEAKTKLAEAEKNLSATQTKFNIEKDHAKTAEASLTSVRAELATAQTRIAQLEKEVKSPLQTGLITIVNASGGKKHQSLSSDGSRNSPIKTPELSPGADKDKVATLKSKVKRLEQERDQLAKLLETEIRRAIRNSPKEKDFVSASLSRRDSTCSTASSILHHEKASITVIEDGMNHRACKETLTEMRESYEKEVQGLIKEIVLYKLDIKGYKKDLRRANSTISKLESTETTKTLSPEQMSDRPDPLRPRASTPNFDNSRRPGPSPAPFRGRRSASVDSPSTGVGLGITVDRPPLRRDFMSLDSTRARDAMPRQGSSTKRKDSGVTVNKRPSGLSGDDERKPRPEIKRAQTHNIMISFDREESPKPFLQVETAGSLRPLSTVAEAGSAIEREH
ncbi:hypothetical protein K461DRAFT_323202 [Myriangium duriaei CBS 260.36]|uniref:Uncharacterized protein n=1 Tax=Myriangium duriaei CBS 260.36 TaxID=1168546 RepID=A0A9P4IWB8_9PEZI|nr:hypothetical protein K461DRAFT_323202 [Myriangium duriaei CBS 260.36]